MSKVACLLDELDGKEFTSWHWQGGHPRVYGKWLTPKQEDEMVATLCKRLQGVDVTKHSLEMQMWWRDHQAADQARVESELAKAETEEKRQAALAKLTHHERKLLGLC
jgi:hypothetical protein